jgi:hypothetical protein
MARAPRGKITKIELGTVLAIPLRGQSWALGQVLHPGIGFYLGVAAVEVLEPLRPDAIDGLPLTLFSWTNDAEVYKGRWSNLGVAKLPVQMPTFPEYKCGEWVESFVGSRLRPLDPIRDEGLNFKTSRSPLLVEDVVKAACRIGEWKPYYDKMRTP